MAIMQKQVNRAITTSTQTPTGATIAPTAQVNIGRWATPITGINGVLSGGTATVNVPTNCRVHSLSFQCAGGTGYTGGPTFTAAAGGISTVVTGAINAAGQVTSVSITTAGSGQTDGVYLLQSGSGGGTGAMVSLVIVGGIGVSVTLKAAGGGGFVSADVFFGNMTHKVNGVSIRDVLPISNQQIVIANGYTPQAGEYTVFFTEPWRKFLRNATMTSWDLAGQGSYQITALINPLVPSPQLTGFYVYDFLRNTHTSGTTTIPFLRVIAQHQYNFQLGSGRTVLSGNQIPITWPILRLWFNGSIPANITEIDIKQDGNLVYQMLTQQSSQLQTQYQFAMNAPIGTGNTTIPNGIVGTPFDFAYISDIDNRPWESLTTSTDLQVLVYSNVAQNLTVIAETMENAYA